MFTSTEIEFLIASLKADQNRTPAMDAWLKRLEAELRKKGKK